MNPILVLLIVFVVTLILGVPFAWSLLLASAASVCMIDGLPLMQIASKMYNGGAKYTLLAIFFFMLAGAIMQHGGISSRMIMFAKACVGHLRGGLSIVVLLVCMLFAALSGSSIATTAAIGAMLYPELVKENYPKGYAAALPVAGGTLGIVIPPSIVFVVYGSTTGTSVSKLLMSGVIPGIMAGVFMCIYAYLYARKHDIPKSNDFSWANVGKSLKEAIWAILMPVIILGGIYTGIFTPTESAAVAVSHQRSPGAHCLGVLHPEHGRGDLDHTAHVPFVGIVMSMYIVLISIPVMAALLYGVATRRMRRARVLHRLLRQSEGDAQEKKNTREWQIWLKALAAPLAGKKERGALSEKLIWAGMRKKWALDAFLVAKLLLVLVTVIAGYLFFEINYSNLMARPFALLKYIVAVVLAARLPDWWLSDQVKKRRTKISQSVPQAIDLLTICVESGVSLEESFGRVATNIAVRAPEISQELSTTRSEMLVLNRADALKRLEKRSGVRELEKLAGTLIQSLQYGTPIVDALRSIAAESRAEQMSSLEEKAGNIAARVGIPLIILVLFPLVALIAAPAAINLIRVF